MTPGSSRLSTRLRQNPHANFEVCGDLLQAGARLYWFTGDRKYLDWTLRLGDYFLLGANHPTRNNKPLRLIDHGCEVVNGLTELYVAVSYALPEKKRPTKVQCTRCSTVSSPKVAMKMACSIPV